MNWSYVLEKYADETPEKEAVVFYDRRLTYKQLSERSNAFAHFFKDYGLSKGDVVGILLNNYLEYIELSFATNKIGVIWLPLNFRLNGDELAYILNNSGAKILISEKEFSKTIDNIKNMLPHITQYIAVGEDVPEGWTSYDDIMKTNLGKEVPTENVGMDDIERLMYTSGTTAHPKGVMLSYGNLYWKNVAHIMNFNITADDKCLVATPLYHVSGMDMWATSVLFAGGTVVILKKYTPVEALETMKREGITQVCMVPTMINKLFEETPRDEFNLEGLKVISDGGEKMPLPLINKFQENLPNTWFADAYGLTETVGGDTFLDKSNMITKLGSVGRPVILLRIRIVDDNGNDVPAGEQGEIILQGPKVFKGYWRDEKATKEAIKDGWFYTGDIGYLDTDGFLYIMDRKKDMIISGGENVASAEIERVIYELPQIRETAVVGIPHPKWLEVPKAFVVLKDNQKLTEKEIIDHCASKLGKFKVPKEVEFISALPRNPSGKVLKRELRNSNRSK